MGTKMGRLFDERPERDEAPVERRNRSLEELRAAQARDRGDDLAHAKLEAAKRFDEIAETTPPDPFVEAAADPKSPEAALLRRDLYLPGTGFLPCETEPEGRSFCQGSWHFRRRLTSSGYWTWAAFERCPIGEAWKAENERGAVRSRIRREP